MEFRPMKIYAIPSNPAIAAFGVRAPARTARQDHLYSPVLEEAWMNDQIVQVKIIAITIRSSQKPLRRFFHIAPINPMAPHGLAPFGAPHDNVLAVPRKTRRFSPIWSVHWIVKGFKSGGSMKVKTRMELADTNLDGIPEKPFEFVSHADLGSGLVRLTSVPKIEAAVALGLVRVVQTPIPNLTFRCAVARYPWANPKAVGPARLAQRYQHQPTPHPISAFKPAN